MVNKPIIMKESVEKAPMKDMLTEAKCQEIIQNLTHNILFSEIDQKIKIYQSSLMSSSYYTVLKLRVLLFSS